MQLSDYQEKIKEFRLPTANQHYVMMGLVGEVGELYSHVAKAIRDSDGMIDLLPVKKELGDILWFVSSLASDFGFSLDDIASQNIEKLESRKARNQIQGSGDER